MKNEEIVKALREHAEWAQANEWEAPITLNDDLAAAADLIEKLTDRCARYAEEIAVLQEREKWVPVTERLPETNEFEEAGGMSKVVLGIVKNDSGSSLFNPCLCVYLSDGRWIFRGKPVTVTHWRPLPDGPEVE